MMTRKTLQGPLRVHVCCVVTALALAATSAAASAGDDIVRIAPAIEVRVELDKPIYRFGDSFRFAVTANQDCYFLVFTIDASDKVEIHDPVASGEYMGYPLLKAGERRESPVPDAPGRAVITPPAGSYQIGALCGREGLAKFGLSNAELKEPAKAGRRGFQLQLHEKLDRIHRSSVAQVTVFYEVRP
jgi:hypothetical protein